MKFTKFFDVKSPQGLNQNEKEVKKQWQSVGVDLYFPEWTPQFLKALIESNIRMYPTIQIIGCGISTTIDEPTIANDPQDWFNQLADAFEDGKLFEIQIDSKGLFGLSGRVQLFTKNDDDFIIRNPLTIPTGIGIDIDLNKYADLRPKSGNMSGYHTEITGLIDENYTYGMGAQILPIPVYVDSFGPDETPQYIPLPVHLKSQQKFVQLTINHACKVFEMDEVSQDVWNDTDRIKTKRGVRTGGFGSTGKFDS